uniref:Uncharacterized protein n=1 Tax=Beihai goldsaddle goatfish picobirnavirus TaxID=2116425 RepID=A0A2P1GN37_9VIRU|nr:hypothetical protein [Beihai goldsaddle goatfish picobirnavirus]
MIMLLNLFPQILGILPKISLVSVLTGTIVRKVYRYLKPVGDLTPNVGNVHHCTTFYPVQKIGEDLGRVASAETAMRSAGLFSSQYLRLSILGFSILFSGYQILKLFNSYFKVTDGKLYLFRHIKLVIKVEHLEEVYFLYRWTRIY